MKSATSSDTALSTPFFVELRGERRSESSSQTRAVGHRSRFAPFEQLLDGGRELRACPELDAPPPRAVVERPVRGLVPGHGLEEVVGAVAIGGLVGLLRVVAVA